MPAVNKIDSNVTNLSVAEETTPGVLPATPIWTQLEPNSYSDFGGSVGKVTRNPINRDRQRRKGSVVSLDAQGGFTQDLTHNSLDAIIQGFFFANFQRSSVFPLPITSVVASSDTFNAASGLTQFAAKDLIFADGFNNPSNNGLHLVSASTGTTVTVSSALVDETPPSTAKLTQVGVETTAGDLDVVVSGDFPVITSATLNFVSQGFVPGEWIYIGAATANSFTNAANNGFKRIRSVAANALTIDKSDVAMVVENNTTKAVRIFYGRCVKNVTGTNIVRRTYQLERELGVPDTDNPSNIQSEYLIGQVANRLAINISSESKIETELGFIGLGHETRDATTGLKSGTRIAPVPGALFNTSSDMNRASLSLVVDGQEAPTPLFAFATEFSVIIDNGATINKAVSRLGGFDVSIGDFVVNGAITAYFTDTASIAAVRNNTNVTLDFLIVASNKGVAIDLPLVTLDGGLANVTKDQPITIPLNQDAVSGEEIASGLNHTLLMTFFDYLPDEADN